MEEAAQTESTVSHAVIVIPDMKVISSAIPMFYVGYMSPMFIGLKNCNFHFTAFSFKCLTFYECTISITIDSSLLSCYL